MSFSVFASMRAGRTATAVGELMSKLPHVPDLLLTPGGFAEIDEATTALAASPGATRACPLSWCSDIIPAPSFRSHIAWHIIEGDYDDADLVCGLCGGVEGCGVTVVDKGGNAHSIDYGKCQSGIILRPGSASDSANIPITAP